MRNRPDWTSYFLGLAKVVSQRSHDVDTQHGCIITDSSHNIIGTGYNGFARGGNRDDTLPLTRPEKYSWMLHSERNALANCVVRPTGGIAYVTGQCCNDCIQALWQHGIDTVYMIDAHGSHLLNNAEQKAIFSRFVEDHDIKIHYVNPDLSWLKTLIDGVS